MEKLELRHIAPYLPYRLKGLFKDEDDNTKNYVSELESDNIEYFLDEATIVLRPLSDLLKEIELKGKKFVPIYKLANTMFINTNFSEFKSNETGFYCQNNLYRFHYNHIENSFYSVDIYNMEFDCVKNQLGLFQKMFEWHFDVFGLIEKGLAVDINTLDNG